MTTKQLSDSIIQLAIEGKLVPQNPNDEPASVLLERIWEEKKLLVKDGKLKNKDQYINNIDKRESSLDIPESWALVRLSQLCVKFSTGPFGTMVHKEDYVESIGHPLINPTNIKNGQIVEDDIKMVSDNKYNDLKNYVLRKDDIVLARRGDLSKIAVISEIEDGWLAGTGSFFMHFVKGLFIPYFIYLYTSFYCQSYLLTKSIGGTMNNLNQSLLANFLIPLPPMAEQQRIVKRIEEILPFIKEYGEAYEEASKMEAELPDKLKKSILQEAIMGKLGTQDIKDEPASMLLDLIREENKMLVKKGVLKKKDVIETPVDEDEKPHKIPKTWEWVHLKFLCNSLIVPQRDKPTKFGGDIPWCRIEDIEGKYLNGSKSNQLVTKELAESMNMHLCPKGSVICACSASIGNQAITTVDCYTNQTFIGIVCKDNVLYNEYLYYFFMSQKQALKDLGKGTTISYISRKKFEEYLIPLPPLAEQHRIVEKIEALFAEIDNMTINNNVINEKKKEEREE